MASEVGGLLIKLSADVGGLTAGEKQATASLDRLDAGATKAQAAVGGLSSAFSSAGGSAEGVAERLEAVRRAAAGIASGAERSASEVAHLRQDFAKLSGAMESASVDRVSASLKGFEKSAGAQGGASNAARGIREVGESAASAEQEARKLREEFKRAVAGEAIVAVSGRIAQALTQLGGAAGAVGAGVQGLGQILQGFFQGGLLGGAVATLGVAIQGVADVVMHAKRAADEMAASMRQAFETAAQGANAAFEGMRQVTAQLRAMQAARSEGISVEQASNEGEIAALEMKIQKLETLRKNQSIAAAERLGAGATTAEYFGRMSEVGATGKDIEATQLQLQAAKMRGEMQAQQRADAQQLQQLGSGLASATKLGGEGQFGAAFARIGKLWTQMGDRTDDAAMALRVSMQDAREALEEQADAARRSAAAVTRNVEGQKRINDSLAAIGRANRGQLGIDEGTSSPHGRFLLGQADASRQAAAAQKDADAWVELQGRVKEIADDAKEEILARDARASFVKLRKAVDDFSDGLAGSMRQAFAAVKNRLGDNLTSGVNDSMDLGNAFAAVGQNMAQQAGGAMANMVQGFTQGGLVGGIIGAIASSKQMSRVMSILGDVFQSVADSIGSILEPIMPFLVIIGMVVKTIFAIIKPLSELLFLEPILHLLFTGLKLLVGAVSAIAAGINWVVVKVKNALFEGIAELLEWISASFFKDEITALRGMIEPQKSFIDTVKDAFNEVNDVDYGAAKLGDAADDAAESLYNLAGFKAEGARFDALAADSKDMAPGSVNIHGDVNIGGTGPSTDWIAQAMRRAAMSRGTPVQGENPFAILAFSTG